jgi:hypothetical protein
MNCRQKQTGQNRRKDNILIFNFSFEKKHTVKTPPDELQRKTSRPKQKK